MRYFRFVSLLLLACFSCSRDDDQLDCPEQTDRTIDVLAGPLLPARGLADWAYLGNKYGGRGDAIEATGYPFFLNWLDGCEEDVSVNIVGHRNERIRFPDNLLLVPEHAILHSYYGIKTGQTINLDPGIGGWTFPTQEVSDYRTIVIQNVPDWDQVSLLPHTSADADIDGSVPGELSIELSPWYASRGYFYIVIKELGASDYYAIKVDPTIEPFTYDFATNKVPVDIHTIALGPSLTWVSVHEVIDGGETRPLQLFFRGLPGEAVTLFVPQTDNPFVVSISSEEGNVYQFSATLHESLPGYLDKTDHGEIPITEFNWNGDYVNLELTTPGYFELRGGDNNPLQYNPAFRGIRQLEGPLPAGKHRLRLQDLPPAFKTTYPGLELPKDIFEDSYLLKFWHYPALPTSEDYWRLNEFPNLDRHLYSFYQIGVN